MNECVPFLKVTDLAKTIAWYEAIGFTCVGTNLIWEPDCELNWARLEWEGLAFMIGPDERRHIPEERDSSLWFNVERVVDVIKKLENMSIAMTVEPATFYGRKVVSFKDINGYNVSFSCALD